MRTVVAISLVLMLAACQTPRAKESPGREIDPFYRLAFTEETPGMINEGSLRDDQGRDAFLLSFRLVFGGNHLSAPSVAVVAGERAQIKLVNQISYIADFDVEIACEPMIADPIIADPVIAILQDGMTLECAATPTKDGDGIVLAWHLDLSEVLKPLRQRNLVIHPAMEKVTVQLPAVKTRSAAGRVRLNPGVETTILSIVEDHELSLSVSAVPVKLEKETDPSSLVLGIDETTRPALQETPSRLTELMDRDAPPPGARISILLATSPTHFEGTPLHLDAHAGEQLTAGLTELRRADLAAIPETGAGVGWRTSLAYHGDYEVKVGTSDSMFDPIIMTRDLGFTCRFSTPGGKPALSWSMETLRDLSTFTTNLAGSVVSLEIPAFDRRTGILRLRSAVDVMPLGKLEDGRTVVLVVRRDVPR